jgi:hypothetical protein
MDDDELFAVFDSKAVQSKKTAGGKDGDKAPKRKRPEDNEEEHAGGKAAADTAAGAALSGSEDEGEGEGEDDEEGEGGNAGTKKSKKIAELCLAAGPGSCTIHASI